jgi:hypothetical protein
MPSPPPAIPAELSQSLTADESSDENADPFEVSATPTMPSPLPAMPTEPSATTCEFIERLRVRPAEVNVNESSQDAAPLLMATLSDPSATEHPSPFRKDVSGLSVTTVAHGPTLSSSSSDPYYGHEQTTKLCVRFVSHLFACPDAPLSSSTQTPMLAHFIATALWTHGNHQQHTQQCIPPSRIGWSAVECPPAPIPHHRILHRIPDPPHLRSPYNPSAHSRAPTRRSSRVRSTTTTSSALPAPPPSRVSTSPRAAAHCTVRSRPVQTARPPVRTALQS